MKDDLKLGESYEVKSPGYPQPYPNAQKCVVMVTAVEGEALYLNIDDAGFGDQYDRLTVSDGDGKGARPMLNIDAGNTAKGEIAGS